MNEEELDYGLDLKRFKRHHKKFPWGLIRKIFITITLIGILLYLNNVLSEKRENTIEGVEIEVDTSIAPVGSPDQ